MGLCAFSVAFSFSKNLLTIKIFTRILLYNIIICDDGEHEARASKESRRVVQGGVVSAFISGPEAANRTREGK
jgi:hypothetical protein